MAIGLPELPYSANALEPYISKATLDLHHGKHHQTYVDKVNGQTSGGPLQASSLEEIVLSAAGRPDRRALFNNAAQAWNHSFYWLSMRPGGGGAPYGAIAQRIEADFGCHGLFAKRFREVAAELFGSGWVWLVHDGHRLAISCTANGNTPLAEGKTPLLTVDLWEHAYYLDFRNRRDVYVEAFLNHLVDWDFANFNLESNAGSRLQPALPRVAVS